MTDELSRPIQEALVDTVERLIAALREERSRCDACITQHEWLRGDRDRYRELYEAACRELESHQPRREVCHGGH